MNTWQVAVVGNLRHASSSPAMPGLKMVALNRPEDLSVHLLPELTGVLLAPQPADLIATRIQAARIRAAGLPLVQLLAAPDFESARIAQAAGADYTLLWPQELSQLPALLAAHHHGHHQHRTGREQGRCIALYNPRGGSGLSTLAVLLSIALQRQNGDTLLVDMDTTWGGLETLLQVTPTQNLLALQALVQARELTASAVSAVVTPHATGLHLLASPADGNGENLWGAEDWAALVEAVRTSYRVSIWAMAPEPPLQAARLWPAFDEVLLVVTPAFTSLTRARRLTEQLPGLGMAATIRFGLVVNRHGMDPTCSAREVATLLDIPLRGSIREDRRLLRLGVAPDDLKSAKRLTGALSDVERLAQALVPTDWVTTRVRRLSLLMRTRGRVV